MYRELCRKFYQDHVTPYHNEWEKKGEISRECWLEAGRQGIILIVIIIIIIINIIILGMLGVTVPPEYGGMGLDIKYSAVHWEEQMYALASGPGFSLHSEIVCPYVMHYGNKINFNEIILKT